MGDRRYGVRSRSRSPRRHSPRSPDFNPSRHSKISQYIGRRIKQYSREAETSRRIEKRDHLDRHPTLCAPKFTEYDNRDRDRYAVGGSRNRSSRMIGKRDNFDRDDSMRSVKLSDYEDAGKVRYTNQAAVGRSSTYDDESYHRDSSVMRFQLDHLLDGPRKSDHLSHTRDYNGVDDTKVTSGGVKGDYHPHSHYSVSGQAGLLPVSRYLDSFKPVALQYERGGRMRSNFYTLADGGVEDTPISNFSGGGGGGSGSSHMPSVASRYLNTDTDRLGYVHFRDELHLEKRDGGLPDREVCRFENKNENFHPQDGFLSIEKPVGREIYKFKKEDDLLSSRGYSKGNSDYMVSSHPEDYVSESSGIVRGRFPGHSGAGDLNMPSDMIRRGSGLTSQSIGFDGYSEKKQNIFSRGPGDQLDDTRSSSRLYIGLPEEKPDDLLYTGRSKFGSMSTRINDVEEEYSDQHMSGVDVLNPTVDKYSDKRPMGDDRLWDQYPFLQVQSTSDKFGASRSLHGRNQDLDMLGTGSSQPNYGTEDYCKYGDFKPEVHHDDVDVGLWSLVEGSDVSKSRAYDLSFDRLYDSPRKGSAFAAFSLVEPSERRPRHKHGRDEVLYEYDVGIRISTDGNGARKIYNQVNVGDEIDLANLSKPKSSKFNYEEAWRVSSEKPNDRSSSIKLQPSHSVDTGVSISRSRDIKKRLGPLPQKLHVSQRLARKHKPSIKKRLAPAPPKKRATLPWIKNLNSDIMASDRGDWAFGDSAGSPHDHDGDHLEDQHTLAKSEPPEKSEDFKQLLQNAFFKFLKQINETQMKRKKYTEQGKAGSLKCIVCGSNSDEFAETESLAKHAFTSKKDGLRSQHLGLHKALCVLMGWKIIEETGREWHCESMSNDETSALKEDLIIWPPVVIVHNSTMDNKNPDERVVISIAKLDMKLRDMGFQSILKVCNGKSANQSMMLVKFNGTLSGLQEAEKLHRSYVQFKHDGAKLKQLKSEPRSSSEATQVVSAERSEDILYGHLGIPEDLDKLDFDTKKRCVLRSKKEILSIVNAPLNTEG